MYRVITFLFGIGFASIASASCLDYSGKYQRIDDKRTFEWVQSGCDSITITSEYLGTYTVKTDGKFRNMPNSSWQEAYFFLNEKLVFSAFKGDGSQRESVVYSKLGSNGLEAEVSYCGDMPKDSRTCSLTKDMYDRL